MISPGTFLCIPVMVWKLFVFCAEKAVVNGV